MVEKLKIFIFFCARSHSAMILSLATVSALSSGRVTSLNSTSSSSSPLDSFNSSTPWSLDEDVSNFSLEPIVRTLTPELQPGTTAVVVQEVSPWDIVLCVTGTLMSCENALVIAVLFYTPALRAPMFILIGSLAVADLLAGLALILNFVFTYLVNNSVELLTLLSVGLLISTFSASVLNILAITVDRYLSLYNALTYHTERMLTFTYILVVFIWISCITLGLLPVLGWNCLKDKSSCSICWPVTKNNAVALAVTFLLVFALMLQLYLQICRIAFRHAQQIAVQHQFLAISTTKGVSTLSAILCTFGACWLPFAMYSIVADSSYPVVYTYVTVVPVICCSVINPIIYAFRNPDIQKSLWMACCGCVPTNLFRRHRTSSDV